MAKNKEIKAINNKQLCVVSGIFLSLFVIILALNVGYVARALSYPFIFLFGAGSLLFYLFICTVGVSLIFRQKPFTFKHFFQPICLFLFFICSLILITYIYSKIKNFDLNLNNVNKTYFSIYENIDKNNYFHPKFLDIYNTYPFAGGYVGYILLASLTTLVNKIFALAMTVILMILCVFFYFYDQFIALFKLFKHRKKKTKKNTAPTRKKENIPLMDAPSTKDIISSASEVPENFDVSYANDVEQPTPSNFEAREHLSFSNVDNSSMSPARFDFRNEKPCSTTAPLSTATIPGAHLLKENEEELKEIDDEETIVNEQLELDFDNQVEEKPKENVMEGQIPLEEPKPITVPPVTKKEVEEPKKVKKPIKWIPPSPDLLQVYDTSQAIEENISVAEYRQKRINEVYANFGLRATCNSYVIGASVTRFNIECEQNVSVKTLEGLVKDISVRLGGISVRLETVVAGQEVSGLEIPNPKITTVSFKEVFTALPDVKEHPLAVAFGKNISGEVVYADFNEFPHLLVAGTTGSGKSIFVNSIVATLIMRCSPDLVRLVIVDPKQIEFKKFSDIPHLLCPIITSGDEAKIMLEKMCKEMKRRYSIFNDAEGSVNIEQYNEWAEENNVEKLPYIVIVLDEYADLVDRCKGFSAPVVSLAQMARAAGIHLIISTQRPSTNVVTGVLKGNLPTHVALMTASSVDSQTIIGVGGAETLLGKGDMLVQSPLVSRVGTVRLQGCYISNKEIVHIVSYLKEHYQTNYWEELMDLVDHASQAGGELVAAGKISIQMDESERAVYESIKEWVKTQEYISMSKIQRECSVGFNKAGRIFKLLQEEGIVALEPESSSRGCKVLVNDRHYDSDNSDNDVSSDELN